MPDNYALLGWILTLFPRARIIHCRRDLRDVALSCWQTQFGKIQWASRIEDLTARINDYRRVMEHWRVVLAGRFLEIEYESLVANQEVETRRLLDWIELPWDAACLRFYESDRVVRTASITQVREPIYNSSVGRWEPYGPYLPQIAELERN